MSNSIQFINKDSVVQAFTDRDVQAWSINQGRQFMFKGYGSDELIPVLEMLESGATNAIYTLKVYEEFEDKKKIKSNTPDDGSFNFRLNAPDMLIRNEQYNSLPGRNDILKRLDEMEERLFEKEENNDPVLGRIGEILSHPAISPLVPGITEKILSFFTSAKQVNAGLISGIETPEENISSIVSELAKHDPQLKEHLKRLLVIAQTNATQFQQIISFFN